MNLRFLGDALDYWKGSLFFRLQREGILIDFLVDQMLTDPKDWRESDFQLYADLLQIRRGQILQHKRKLKEEREQYFTEVTHTGDLFLDPDTGITLRYTSRIERYIKISEICQLLRGNLPRILCIYQHIRGKKTKDRVTALVSAIGKSGAKVYCCSYQTPTVAMLFISARQNRIKPVYEYFKNYLGRHSSGMRVAVMLDVT